jgi:predicted signal transduction protein with EAL and GGDEF domain
VVAEGVEDHQTWDELSALDCELIQGYLISRPVPAADLERQLQAQRDQRLAAGGATPEALPREQLNSPQSTAGVPG